jgi:N-acetylmuramoyl-L-alanine amidase
VSPKAHIRLRRKLLRSAVEDNVRTIQGAIPDSLRARRRFRAWVGRASIALFPLILLGSSYFMSRDAAAVPDPTTQTRRAAMKREARAAALSSATFAAPGPIDSTALPLAVRTIVLDAGHGGQDPGAVHFGVAEKEVTLDLVRRLRLLLQADGYEVIVTRSTDRTMSLVERAKIANEIEGDLFVSVHINSVRSPNRRGIETYYLGPSDDPEITQLAAEENRNSGYTISDMRRLLEGIYADVRQDESFRLASSVQSALFTSMSKNAPELQNWGVRRAPFVVLVATDMPAILAEVSCVTNPTEASLLKLDDHRQKLAEALFSGIRGYTLQHDRATQKGI